MAGATWRRWHLATATTSALVVGAAALSGVRQLDLVPWPSATSGPYALEFTDAGAPAAPTSGPMPTPSSAVDAVMPAEGPVASAPGRLGTASTSSAATSSPPPAGTQPSLPDDRADDAGSAVPAPLPDTRGVVRIVVHPTTTTTAPAPTPPPGGSATTSTPTSAPPIDDGGGGLKIADAVLRERAEIELRVFGAAYVLVTISVDDLAGQPAAVIDATRATREQAAIAAAQLPADRVVHVGAVDVTFAATLLSLDELDRLVNAAYTNVVADETFGGLGASTTTSSSPASTTSPTPSSTTSSTMSTTSSTMSTTSSTMSTTTAG